MFLQNSKGLDPQSTKPCVFFKQCKTKTTHWKNLILVHKKDPKTHKSQTVVDASHLPTTISALKNSRVLPLFKGRYGARARGEISLSLLEVQRSSLRRTAEQQPKANFYSPHLCSVAWEACNRTERTALGASAAIKGLAVRDPWLFMECLKWLERSLLTILHLKGYDYVRKM